MYVHRKDEDNALVLRLSRAEVYRLIDIDDPATQRRAVGLLVAADLLRPHRNNRGPDVDGYTLAPSWTMTEAPHLRQRARRLLAEDPRPVEKTAQSQGRPLRWD